MNIFEIIIINALVPSSIAPYLMPLLRQASEVRPYCLTSVKPESVILDKITAMILRRHLPHIPEEGIAKWLGLMASDLEASVAELGAKIGTALNEVIVFTVRNIFIRKKSLDTKIFA